MHGRMRMRGAQSHYRTHDKFTQGVGDIKKVIWSCIVAFPLLWVSCNIVFSVASCWHKLLLSILSVCPCLFVPHVVVTFPSCALDSLWVPLVHLVFWCSDLTLPVPSTASECPLCVQFPLVSWLDPPCALNSKWVLLMSSVSFSVLTWPSLCPQQDVSAPYVLSFFQYPDFNPPCSLNSLWVPLCAQFLSVSWLDPPCVLNSK
jgi:hypothetical protein